MGCTRIGRSAFLFVVALLAGCSNGDAYKVTASLSTDRLVFNAASPEAPTPAAQTVIANLSADTVYVAVMQSGKAIANVTHFLSGKVAQIDVTPASPDVLGAGNFAGAITVTPYGCADANCSRLTPGAAQVVHVTLGIPPIIHFVAPYVGTASMSADTIIRGRGFSGINIQGVRFGTTPASEFHVLSDTQLSATYPALPSGKYAVQIDVPDSPGTIQSSAELAVVDAPGFVAGTLAYPSAVSDVLKVVYDAERSALLLAVTDAGGGKIIRYPSVSGVWGSAVTASITNLSDVALSTNGSELLVLSQGALATTGPSDLVSTGSTPAPALESGVVLKHLAVANDGLAVVTTGNNTTGATPLFVYNTRVPAFSQPETTPSLNNSTPGAAENGALIALAQGDPSLTTAPAVYAYSSFSGQFSATSINLNQNDVSPVVDRDAKRIVLNGTDVYDTAYNLLGKLPATTLAVAISPDASRAYTFDSAAGTIRTFDLTVVNATPSTDVYPEVGTGITPAGNPGAGAKMIISPDGGTLFIAGCDQVVIEPTP